MNINTKKHNHSIKRVRHSDSIKEIGQRLIEKVHTLIDKFKSLSTGKKITVLLARLAQIAAAIVAAKEAKNFDTIKSEYKKFVKVRGQIEKVGWDYVKQDYGNSGLLGKKYEEHLNGFVKPTLKIILSLAGALAAQVVANKARQDSRLKKDVNIESILKGIGITAASLGIGALISKLMNRSPDNKLIKQIQKGEVTEYDLVRDFAQDAIRDILEQHRRHQLTEEQVAYLDEAIHALQTCKTFAQLKRVVAHREIDRVEALYKKAKSSKTDSAIMRQHKDFGLADIASKLKDMSGKLVGELRIMARSNPEFSKMLSAAIGMTAFWDVVTGVRSVGEAGYKTFKRLFSNVEQYKRYYAGDVIIDRLVRGIGRLGLAFFKYKAASKINAFSNGY